MLDMELLYFVMLYEVVFLGEPLEDIVASSAVVINYDIVRMKVGKWISIRRAFLVFMPMVHKETEGMWVLLHSMKEGGREGGCFFIYVEV